MGQAELFSAEEMDSSPVVQAARSPAPAPPGPEAALATSRRITATLLGQLEEAEAMPWPDDSIRMWRSIFEVNCARLPDGEAAERRASLARELKRFGIV